MARNESTIRLPVAPAEAFDLMMQPEQFPVFMPGIISAEKIGDGIYKLEVQADDQTKHLTRVAWSVIEKPRRLVWRSKGGAKWNGEFLTRPTSDGSEVRLIIDFCPANQDPEVMEPEWSASLALLAFQAYTIGGGQTPPPAA